MWRFAVSSALVAASVIAGTGAAQAQSAMLNLPRTSQHARITQRIGITDVTIDYHRPLVNGRKIFGGLQAWGQVWRAGANENTTIDFSDPVTVEGKPLPKGVYGLHMIPDPRSWVIIFSRNSTAWGSFTYDPSEDALRITVMPQTIANCELLTYDFDAPAADSLRIAMSWEKVRVGFRIAVNTPEIVSQSLRNQLRSRIQFEWQPWMEAASYLLDNHLSAEEAAKYAGLSIQNEDRFENEFIKARALKELGHTQESLAAYQTALKLGTQPLIHSFARGLQAQGRKSDALELFRDNIKKDPTTWVAHNELARIAVSKGDYSTAVTEMKAAEEKSPPALRSQVQDLIRLLENKMDIN
jgi:hypothetical protein